MRNSKKIQKNVLDTTNIRDSSHKECSYKQQKDVFIFFLGFCFKWYKNSERFFHLLVGLPSYEKYLDYHRKYHPNCTPKTRKEFFMDSQNKRYSRDGAKKCC